MSAVILVTGAAGFIGFHLSKRLLSDGHTVVGVDNLNDYYDPQLKADRLQQLVELGLEFSRGDLAELEFCRHLFATHRFSRIVHLAAQAGVGYSKINPHAYMRSNLVAYLNLLECARELGSDLEHLIYASSSSVYGTNRVLPFTTDEITDTPVSLYGATKKANELMAHSYAWTYGLPMTGLRFFTVYGPWGRPDMSLYLFASAILESRPIQLFNYGKMRRDFTYVDDVVEGIARLLPLPPQPGDGRAPAAVYNIGNSSPIDLTTFVGLIEEALGKKAVVELEALQVGDVVETFADVQPLERLVGFRPSTSMEVGVRRCIDWYLEYRRQREN